MKKYLLLFLLLPYISSAQDYSYFAGARSAGIAHSSVALSDIWASHHNQAALAFLKKPTAAISYQKRYFLPDLNLGNAAFAYPFKRSSIGLSLDYFGFDLYHESKIGLNYAQAFGKRFSMGLQLNYHDYFVAEGSGNPNKAITFEAGILGKPTDKLSLGFHIFNPTENLKNPETGERLPYLASFGCLYQFNKDVFLSAEVKKQQTFKEHYATGVEYCFLQKIVLRTGVGIQPLSNSFGLGLKFDSFSADISYEYAQLPGGNASLSLQYAF